MRKKTKKNRTPILSRAKEWLLPLWCRAFLSRVVVGGLSVGVLGAVAVVFIKAVEGPDLFPINELVIEGSFQRVTQREITEVIAPAARQGFFGANIEEIKERLMSLAWIERVALRRVWPDALHIKVSEQHASARWDSGGLINAHGQIFYPAPATYPQGLPALKGPTNALAEIATAYRQYQANLASASISIKRLELDERRAWRVVLDSGLELVLGRRNGEHRLRRFARAYSKLLAIHVQDVQQVDLRYPNGFAIRWKSSSRRPPGLRVGQS